MLVAGTTDVQKDRVQQVVTKVLSFIEAFLEKGLQSTKYAFYKCLQAVNLMHLLDNDGRLSEQLKKRLAVLLDKLDEDFLPQLT